MPTGAGQLREAVVEALREVRDPELPVNIYDLGLVYDIDMDADRGIQVTMTLTTPNCPVAELIPEQVRKAVLAVPGVSQVVVNLVWQPPWSSERMSEDARLQLDMMGITWSESGLPQSSITPLTFGHTEQPPGS